MKEPSHVTEAPTLLGNSFSQQVISSHWEIKSWLGWVLHNIFMDLTGTASFWKSQACWWTCRSWWCPLFSPLSALHKPTEASFHMEPMAAGQYAIIAIHSWRSTLTDYLVNFEQRCGLHWVSHPKPCTTSCLVFLPRASRAASQPWAAPSIL